MNNRRRLGRWMAVVATGGFMLQFAGCLSGMVPILVSAGESALLSLLVSGAVP